MLLLVGRDYKAQWLVYTQTTRQEEGFGSIDDDHLMA